MSTRVSLRPGLSTGWWLGGLVLTALAGLAGVQVWLADWPASGAPGLALINAEGGLPGCSATDRDGARPELETGMHGMRSRHARFSWHAGALFAATPSALCPTPEADASFADEAVDAGEPTRRELERELTALRVDNALLTAQIAQLEQDKAELQIDVEHDRLGADLRHALRRDFADVARGSLEAGDRSWSFENELAEILLSSAEVMRPGEITDPATGYEIPNPEAFDWPTLRATLGDGLIRSLAQALPGLLRERALSPSVRSWFLCGGTTTTIVQYHGFVGSEIVVTGSITVSGKSDPIAEAARREDEQSEARYHRSIESVLGLRIDDDE